uniref:AlNc14C349G10901 protein n=1 Tax=Albugo laibachii Nc14 TaxID=890382 RepID=F0WXF0_9STRA|nr:AlNc14C349G10901 [Albugo laibachii Nc14]|eukprot:CCA26142.1 AlNc14C349G10901 [Albugo laibachii Nc14]
MNSIHFLVRYNDVSNSIAPPKCEDVSYAWLRERIEDLFPERPRSWGVLYRDDEQEAVTISNDEELKEACHVASDLTEDDVQKDGFCLYVVSRLTLRDHLEELQCTMSKLAIAAKQTTVSSTSRCAEVGRETLVSSASLTKSMMQKTRHEIGNRISRVHQYVREQRSRFSSRDSMDSSDSFDRWNDKLGDPILKKYPVFNTKSSFETNEQNAQSKSPMKISDQLETKIEKDDSSATSEQNTEAASIESDEATSDADTDAESDDEESKEKTQNLSPDALARNQLRRRWREQIALIRNVLPEANVDDVCRLLQTHNGNADAVTMALSE